MPVIIGQSSALDLHIDGSVGKFDVHADSETSKAVPVKYLLTHVGLQTSGGMQDRLLKQMAPVREVFPLERLQFDEIMQRDLDDARVSSELIPYLIEDGITGLVKVFPPIIVVVVPTNESKLPAYSYPAVTEQDESIDGHTFSVLTSGLVGEEVFSFRQYKRQDGTLDQHNNARLSLNQNRTRLVIVDGQHRAMALLALYRNKTGWPDGIKQKYEKYYRIWSPERLASYDFANLQLPVMFCTFPTLQGETAPIAVKDACRSVFLALNKNARPVTDSTNRLLDDRNVVAQFLRDVLASVKNERTGRAIRIHHIVLDHPKKEKLRTPIAVSTVLWLYRAIQFLMLHTQTVGGTSGVSQPQENLHLKRDLASCFGRLNMRNQLGEDVYNTTKLHNCPKSIQEQLSLEFMRRYGSYIIRMLDKFPAYAASHEVANDTYSELEREKTGLMQQTILFGQHGMMQTFNGYLNYLSNAKSSRIKVEDHAGDSEEDVRVTRRHFEDTKAALEQRVNDVRRRRIKSLLSSVPKGFREAPEAQFAYRGLMSNVFCTAAFQMGLYVTYFDAVENVLDTVNREWPEAAEEIFSSFMDAVTGFFLPDSAASAKAPIRIFIGTVSGSGPELAVAKSDKCLRRILLTGELKQDYWPIVRYILLEIWHKSCAEAGCPSGLREYLEGEVTKCRAGALLSYQKRQRNAEASRDGVKVKDLADAKLQSIDAQCVKDFLNALKPLGVHLSGEDLVTQSVEEVDASLPSDSGGVSMDFEEDESDVSTDEDGEAFFIDE